MDWNTKELKHVHAFIGEDEKAVDPDNFEIEFAVSAEIVDRNREVVTAEAVLEAIGRKNEFAANPICLPCHQHRLPDGMPPCVGMWKTATARIVSGLTKMVLRFAEQYELAKNYWYLYSQKFMRAVSIGFKVIEGHEEVREGIRYFIITQIELYEISCVAVGANPQALSTLKTIGNWDEEQNSGVRIQESEVKSLAEAIENRLAEKLHETEGRILAALDELAETVAPKNTLYLDPLDEADPQPGGKASGEDGGGDRQAWLDLLKKIEQQIQRG